MGLPEKEMKKCCIEERVLPVSAEDATKLLQSSLNKCKKDSPKKIAIVMDLFSKVDDETGLNVIRSQAEKILTEEAHISGGVEAISAIIKSNTNVAFEVLQFLTEIAPKVQSQFGTKTLREWIEKCTESSEIPVDAVSNAIYAAVNYEYSPDSSGRKKAESAVKWAYKQMKKAGPNAPRDMFNQLADRIADTGSRVASSTMNHLIQGK